VIGILSKKKLSDRHCITVPVLFSPRVAEIRPGELVFGCTTSICFLVIMHASFCVEVFANHSVLGMTNLYQRFILINEDFTTSLGHVNRRETAIHTFYFGFWMLVWFCSVWFSPQRSFVLPKALHNYYTTSCFYQHKHTC
jgi:hypothetical protein